MPNFSALMENGSLGPAGGVHAQRSLRPAPDLAHRQDARQASPDLGRPLFPARAPPPARGRAAFHPLPPDDPARPAVVSSPIAAPARVKDLWRIAVDAGLDGPGRLRRPPAGPAAAPAGRPGPTPRSASSFRTSSSRRPACSSPPAGPCGPTTRPRTAAFARSRTQQPPR